jgi:hypothetical protein
MAKKRSSPSIMSQGQNGGILGSGIFGMFGTTIKCESTDDSMYCSIMKLFNLLVVFLIVAFIIYMAYNFYTSYMATNSPFRKRRS